MNYNTVFISVSVSLEETRLDSVTKLTNHKSEESALVLPLVPVKVPS